MYHGLVIMRKKEFNCCICHKKINRNNRLVHQIYDNKETYGKFDSYKIYDFCDECFKIFKYWICKHNKKEK